MEDTDRLFSMELTIWTWMICYTVRETVKPNVPDVLSLRLTTKFLRSNPIRLVSVGYLKEEVHIQTSYYLNSKREHQAYNFWSRPAFMRKRSEKHRQRESAKLRRVFGGHRILYVTAKNILNTGSNKSQIFQCFMFHKE